MRLLVTTFSSVLLMTACAEREKTVCVRQAMDDMELSRGLAVYGDRNGTATIVKQNFFDFRGQNHQLPMASLTKPIIAEQFRRRSESGALMLDAQLKEVAPYLNLTSDTKNRTIRQLIQHQGGFNRKGYDPLLMNGEPDCKFASRFAAEYGPELPAGTEIRYSNEGYCLLGQILQQQRDVPGNIMAALKSPIGGAGGWVASISDTYQALRATMPIHDLPSKISLGDGSYYGYGWRHWPSGRGRPRWTHFGRLPGFISIAATDGEERLIVAHFQGDPRNVEEASAKAVNKLWECMEEARIE